MNATAVNRNQAQETNPFEQSFSSASPKHDYNHSKITQDGMIDVWVSDTSSYSYNSVNNDAFSVSDHDDNSDDTFLINSNTTTAAATAAAPHFEFEQQRPKRHTNEVYQQTHFVNNSKQKTPKKRTRTVKLPEDEEKRKNFLERNRLAALKCRQRKKQWLSNLQTRVEYLANDNDQLQMESEALRKQIMELKSLLVNHKECPQYNAQLMKNSAQQQQQHQHQPVYHQDFSTMH
ncbi:hypothetical protein INT47_013083 [Mucor saturninus]|uniref:BZIP domain-containing protein n=1 Tax=Mucor saturninus TaxID=64648 RepID=A0A8H7R264_9FUNG|nr:hypothetical protein INT47_013083 [Mucor saturninus]